MSGQRRWLEIKRALRRQDQGAATALHSSSNGALDDVESEDAANGAVAQGVCVAENDVDCVRLQLGRGCDGGPAAIGAIGDKACVKKASKRSARGATVGAA